MAGAIAKLYATLGLDTRDFDQGIAQTQGKVKSFASGFKSNMMTGLGLGVGGGVGFMAAGAATAAVGGLVSIMGDAVAMAAEEEAAMAQLSKAIEENDRAWDGNVDAVEEVIRAGERLAFADSEQRDALRQLVAMTGDVEQAYDLMATAMDLARLRGMNLVDASLLIGKVAAGNVGILSRYGIVLDKGTSATEALAEIQRRAAGQAEAYAQTTAGKFVRAQLAMENAMEDLGAALLPVAAVLAELAADIIPRLVDEAGKALKPIADLVGQLGGLVDKINEIDPGLLGHFFNAVRIVGTGGTVLAIDSLDDVQRGLQRASEGADIFAATGVDAFEGGAAAVDEMTGRVSALTSVLASQTRAFLTGAIAVDPGIGETFTEEMEQAKAAVRVGLSEIRDLLSKKRPRFISDEDREANMQRRIRGLRERAAQARAAGDTRSARKYEQALASQQTAYDRFSGRQTQVSTAISKAHRKAGGKVQDTWTDTRKHGEGEARRLRQTTVSEARQIQRGIDAINLTSTGIRLMAELAQGIRIGMFQAMAAAALAASNIARILASTPTTPQQARAARGAVGGGGGTTVIQAGVLVADDRGIDALDQRMTNRRRARNRGP